MAQRAIHLAQYETFRKDADLAKLSSNLRVEAMFLAAYQLIEACAASAGVHIGKHQNVRRELERNLDLFGDQTRPLWQAFQELESRIRPKFLYGQRWTTADLEHAQVALAKIEKICRARLGQ